MPRLRGIPIRTNGEGESSTAHLNLSRTLADVWGIPAEQPEHEPVPQVLPTVHATKPLSVYRTRYAGFDRTERLRK